MTAFHNAAGGIVESPPSEPPGNFPARVSLGFEKTPYWMAVVRLAT